MRAMQSYLFMLILFGLGGLIGPGSAWAGSITQTFNFNLNAIGSANNYEAILLNQFNPSAGGH